MALTFATANTFTPGRIKAIRARLGMNQEEFAEYIGADKSQVSQWETGKTRPRYGKSIFRLLRAEKESRGQACERCSEPEGDE